MLETVGYAGISYYNNGEFIMNSLISAYKDLIVLFTDKRISASEFETEFLKLFKNDKSQDENFYEIIKPLFYAIEDFCSDPEIRDDDDLDENQLLEAANVTLEELDRLTSETPGLRIESDTELALILKKLLQEIETLPQKMKEAIKEGMTEKAITGDIIEKEINVGTHEKAPY